jgi:hypothetical protein
MGGVIRRIVGPALIVLGVVLCFVATVAVPDSEPQLGVIAILVIVECIGTGIALSGTAPKANH